MSLTTGLTHYCTFDTDATDSVGSDDGIVTGATNGSNFGKINNGFNLDGYNDKITFSNSLINTGGSFSISLWVRPDDFGTLTEYDYIIAKNDAYQSSGFTVRIYPKNNELDIVMKNAGQALVNRVHNFSDYVGTYQHLVIVYDDDNHSLTLYLNGSLHTTATNASYSGWTDSSPVVIGFVDPNTNSYNKYFDGAADEFGVWDRVLSAQEASDLYNSGDALPYPFTSGWAGTILGITNPAKINGIDVANISKVNGQ